MTGREKLGAHMDVWRTDFAAKKRAELEELGYRPRWEMCQPSGDDELREAFGFVLDRIDAIEGTKKK